METKNLQDRLYDDLKNGAEVGKDFSLEDGLLIYNGAKEPGSFKLYKSKIDKINQNFEEYYKQKNQENVLYSDEKEIKADLLNKYIGFEKENRYSIHQSNLINGINNGLSKDKTKNIGNCLCLTQMYSILGQREHLDLGVLYYSNPKSLLNHIMLNLITENKKIPIETTNYEGFGLKYNQKEIELTTKDLFYLVLLRFADSSNIPFNRKKEYFDLLEEKNYFDLSDLYCVRGNTNYEFGKDKQALEDYMISIEKNPENLCSRFNRAHMLKNEKDRYFKILELKYIYRHAEGQLKEKAYNQLLISKPTKVKYSPDVDNGSDFCEFAD